MAKPAFNQPFKTALTIKTYGQALAVCRTRRGYSHKDVADRCGASKAQVKSWEANEAVPDRQTRKRLYASLQQLRHFEHLLPAEAEPTTREDHIELEAAERAGSVVDAFVEVEQEQESVPKTFGQALRAARLREGLSQAEMAALIPVGPTAISTWELDEARPIQSHLAKLVLLFPELGAFSIESRDSDKPGVPLGTSPQAVAPAPEPAPLTVSLALVPTPQPKTAAELGAEYGMALLDVKMCTLDVERLERELFAVQVRLEEAKAAADKARDALLAGTVGPGAK